MIPQCVYQTPKQSSLRRAVIRRIRRSYDDTRRASSNLSSSSGLSLGNTAPSTSSIAGTGTTVTTTSTTSSSSSSPTSSQSIPLAQQYQNYNHQRLLSSMKNKAFINPLLEQQQQSQNQNYSSLIQFQQTYTKLDSPWATLGFAMGAAAVVATVGVLMDESKKESSTLRSSSLSSSNEESQQQQDESAGTKPEPTPSSDNETMTLNATSSSTSSDDDEVDPYDNLPDEDEPTDCSMCRTFREGPCRPFWRKLERCFKDHENEENGATKCMKYFTPHQRCLVNYSNLYQLISLDHKQELVTDFEKSVTMEERRCWGCIKNASGPNAIQMDWGKWPEFINEVGFGFNQMVNPDNDEETKEESKSTPLWKRFPFDTEPVLITGTAHIPQTTKSASADESSTETTPKEDLILKVSWATDQDGMVLGLSYNQYYGRLLEQASPKSKDENSSEEKTKDEDKDADETESADLTTKYPLEFFIIPSGTEHVTIHALYAENPVHVPPTKEILDVLLYESRPYSLKKAIDETSPVLSAEQESEKATTDTTNVPTSLQTTNEQPKEEHHNDRQVVAATSSSESQGKEVSDEDSA